MSNLVSVIQEAITSGVIYDIFSHYVKEIYNKANDFVLCQYIKSQIKSLESAKNLEDDEIDSVVKTVEATIIETPQEIKEIADEEKKKEAFNWYFEKIIINSFKDIENSKIKINGKSKFIKDSFVGVKNSEINI